MAILLLGLILGLVILGRQWRVFGLTETIVYVVGFGLLVLFSTYRWSVLCLERIIIDDQGIERLHPFLSPISANWEDISSIGYSRWRDALLLRRETKTALQISIYVDGLGRLRRFLNRRFDVAATGWLADLLPALPEDQA